LAVSKVMYFVESATLRIIDLNGRLIKFEEVATNASYHKIDVSNLANGKYILQVVGDANNTIESKSFVKF